MQLCEEMQIPNYASGKEHRRYGEKGEVMDMPKMCISLTPHFQSLLYLMISIQLSTLERI